MRFCPREKKVEQKLELAMFFWPRGKKSHFTPYNQGVKLLIIQDGPSYSIFAIKPFIF
jgi:hypothetical protein